MRPAALPRVRARIAELPGDGIGPEVTSAARLMLEAVAKRFGHELEFVTGAIGGCAIMAGGTPLTPQTLELCRSADAVLLGAVGGPQWDNPEVSVRPEQGLLELRRALGCYANLRPVRSDPALAHLSPLRPDLLTDIDLIVVRELTGGIYFGAHTVEPDATGFRATDVCTYTTSEIARVTRVAGALARTRRGRVTSVDKANVLATSQLWRRVTTAIMRDEFPDVHLKHMLVDTCAMQLVRDPAPFDVVLTENMFGDILTDEAAVLAGSIGLLPSASLGERAGGAAQTGIYEPIHGSAPTIAGRGIANPVGAILSAALLLRYSLGLDREALAVEAAVNSVLRASRGTPDLHPQFSLSTSSFAQAAADALLHDEPRDMVMHAT